MSEIRQCPNCNGKRGWEESVCGEGCCRSGVRCDTCLGTGIHPDDIAASLAAAQTMIEEKYKEIVRLQRARIGDSEIIGRWQCQAEQAESELAKVKAERDIAIKELSETARKLGREQAEKEEAVELIKYIFYNISSIAYTSPIHQYSMTINMIYDGINSFLNRIEKQASKEFSPDKTVADEAVCTAPDADQERSK